MKNLLLYRFKNDVKIQNTILLNNAYSYDKIYHSYDNQLKTLVKE